MSKEDGEVIQDYARLILKDDAGPKRKREALVPTSESPLRHTEHERVVKKIAKKKLPLKTSR